MSLYTVLVLRMAHRKWKEIKQQPSMLPGPAGCSWLLLSIFQFPLGHPEHEHCKSLFSNLPFLVSIPQAQPAYRIHFVKLLNYFQHHSTAYHSWTLACFVTSHFRGLCPLWFCLAYIPFLSVFNFLFQPVDLLRSRIVAIQRTWNGCRILQKAAVAIYAATLIDLSENQKKRNEYQYSTVFFATHRGFLPTAQSFTLHLISLSFIVFQVALRGFLVILALSLHAIFEGMAVGLTQKARISAVRSLRPKLKNVWYFSWSFRFMIVRLWPILFPQASYVWYLFFAIAAHKFVISFCIGIQFVSSGLRPLFIVLYQARKWSLFLENTQCT